MINFTYTMIIYDGNLKCGRAWIANSYLKHVKCTKDNLKENILNVACFGVYPK